MTTPETLAPATTEAAEPPADAAAPPAAPETQAAPALTPEQLQEAKLEALRVKNAERRAKLEARSKELDDRSKTVEEKERAVASWREDARALLNATGAPAQEVLSELVRQAEADGTPAGEMAKMQKAWRAELDATKAELAALKAEREAEKAAAAERAAAERQSEAERAFVEGTLGGEKYAALRAFYSPAELAQSGHVYADRLMAAGKRVTLEAVADAILEEHNKWAARFGPATTAPKPAPEPAGKTVNGGRKAPNTLSNAGQESPPPRKLTWEEKVRRAADKARAAGP